MPEVRGPSPVIQAQYSIAPTASTFLQGTGHVFAIEVEPRLGRSLVALIDHRAVRCDSVGAGRLSWRCQAGIAGGAVGQSMRGFASVRGRPHRTHRCRCRRGPAHGRRRGRWPRRRHRWRSDERKIGADHLLGGRRAADRQVPPPAANRSSSDALDTGQFLDGPKGMVPPVGEDVAYPGRADTGNQSQFVRRCGVQIDHTFELALFGPRQGAERCEHEECGCEGPTHTLFSVSGSNKLPRPVGTPRGRAPQSSGWRVRMP
jgi:hypothetical protein